MNDNFKLVEEMLNNDAEIGNLDRVRVQSNWNEKKDG
jgi:hypothetical protein